MLLPIRDYRRSRTTPILKFVIIGINVLVFLFQTFMVGGSGGEADYGIVRGSQCIPLSGGDRFIFENGVKPCELLSTCGETQVCVIEDRRVVDVTTVEGPFPASPLPAWLTIFSAMFVHGGLLHIASNMWFLWIFGDNVEDRMGTGRFLVFYLLTGLVAAAAQIVSNPASSTPMVGASGAVAGVLGAYMMLYPNGRVLTLMWIVWFIQFIELPAVIVLGMWILLQVIQALIGQGMLSGGGVAYLAHIGGFLAGVVLVKVFAQSEQPDYL